jgi:hypothetical protein
MKAAPRLGVLMLAVTALLVALTTGSGAATPFVTTISTDTLTNTASQHHTEVEPDTFAFGATEVAAFQVGRIYNGGAGAIGWATSTDGGATWTNGLLPGLTTATTPSGPYSRATDPSVAYDAADHRWLILSQAMNGTVGAAMVVSSSTDGIHWGNPVVAATKGSNLDKDWIVCDNVSTAFAGHCYVTYDDFGNNDLIYNATSTDGGATWGTPHTTADAIHGIGGQPVVQPNGTVVVPTDNGAESAMFSYRSTDGGQTWSATTPIAHINHHRVHGAIRDSKLPSAEVDGAGTVYLAWEDCRFRVNCRSNDIVVATSGDGLTWSAPTRVPIDDVAGTADHFIPGIAVDPATSGASAHVAVTYYFYPVAACSGAACQLQVGQISSSTSLTGWGTATTLTPTPMHPNWLPKTSQGRMVGDYISTSYVSGRPVAAFALASAPDAAGFHEATAAGSGS